MGGYRFLSVAAIDRRHRLGIRHSIQKVTYRWHDPGTPWPVEPHPPAVAGDQSHPLHPRVPGVRG